MKDPNWVKRNKLYQSLYLVYQTIINNRTAYALEQLKQCFNLTHTNWKEKKKQATLRDQTKEEPGTNKEINPLQKFFEYQYKAW